MFFGVLEHARQEQRHAHGHIPQLAHTVHKIAYNDEVGDGLENKVKEKKAAIKGGGNAGEEKKEDDGDSKKAAAGGGDKTAESKKKSS